MSYRLLAIFAHLFALLFAAFFTETLMAQMNNLPRFYPAQYLPWFKWGYFAAMLVATTLAGYFIARKDDRP